MHNSTHTASERERERGGLFQYKLCVVSLKDIDREDDSDMSRTDSVKEHLTTQKLDMRTAVIVNHGWTETIRYNFIISKELADEKRSKKHRELEWHSVEQRPPPRQLIPQNCYY